MSRDCVISTAKLVATALFLLLNESREVLHLLGGGVVQRGQHAGYKVVDVHEIALQRVTLRGATQAGRGKRRARQETSTRPCAVGTSVAASG